VLIGMHGAALSHILFMPVGAKVIELRPKPRMGWNCFHHMAVLAGVRYYEWINWGYPKNYRIDKQGDYTRIDSTEIVEIISNFFTKNDF
jgi:capsular polysaccharide biosynthesis protein